jgi:hypothetical protein
VGAHARLHPLGHKALIVLHDHPVQLDHQEPEVSGSGAATTLVRSAASDLMIFDQLDPSAQAPWTSTTLAHSRPSLPPSMDRNLCKLI